MSTTNSGNIAKRLLVIFEFILLLLENCFLRDGRGNRDLAEYMGEKGGGYFWVEMGLDVTWWRLLG